MFLSGLERDGLVDVVELPTKIPAKPENAEPIIYALLRLVAADAKDSAELKSIREIEVVIRHPDFSEPIPLPEKRCVGRTVILEEPSERRCLAYVLRKPWVIESVRRSVERFAARLGIKTKNRGERTNPTLGRLLDDLHKAGSLAAERITLKGTSIDRYGGMAINKAFVTRLPDGRRRVELGNFTDDGHGVLL
jgi:hypothetical protein